MARAPILSVPIASPDPVPAGGGLASRAATAPPVEIPVAEVTAPCSTGMFLAIIGAASAFFTCTFGFGFTFADATFALGAPPCKPPIGGGG